jgi:hypothetical protein
MLALRDVLSLLVLTLVVLLVHGYHPFADDAGIYVTGIRKLADPTLYQPDAALALANAHLSVFPHFCAAIIRLTYVSLTDLLFAIYLLTILAFLFSCHALARRIFASAAAQWSAVALAAACFTLPAAGTALLVMDPYVTSRSFSTPLGLFALAAIIDRRALQAAFLLLLAALMHPLMAVYAAAFVFLFALVDRGHTRLVLIVSSVGPLAAAGLYLSTLHSPASVAYRQAILMPVHSYLFPTRWIRHDYLGLMAPAIFFATVALRFGLRTVAGRLSTTALLVAVSSSLSAFLFIHPAGPYLLARLQPMRIFQMVYAVAILLVGGFIGNFASCQVKSETRPPKRSGARLAVFAVPAVIAVIMFLVQRDAYVYSDHIEWPGTALRNPWQQAFRWIRAHTPPNAVFAANPELSSLDGEDSHSFRAMTARSLLAEEKDSGLVVVFPYLASQWARERNAQEGLDQLSDAQRLARLQPLGATWLLLSASSVTSLPCPYRNAVAKVCQLKSSQ